MAGVQLILMDFIGIFVISVFLKVCYFLEENTIVCLKDQQFTFSPRLADVSFVQICQPALPQQFRRIVMILKIDCACPIILLTRELLCGGHFTPDWPCYPGLAKEACREMAVWDSRKCFVVEKINLEKWFLIFCFISFYLILYLELGYPSYRLKKKIQLADLSREDRFRSLKKLILTF